MAFYFQFVKSSSFLCLLDINPLLFLLI